MKLLRGLWRIIYSVVIPIVLIILVMTLFSITGTYGVKTTVESGEGVINASVSGSLDLTSLLFKGSVIGFTLNTKVNVDNVTYDSKGDPTFVFGQSSENFQFNGFDMTYNYLCLVAILIILIGIFITLIAYNSKTLTLIGTIALIVASIIILTRDGVFDPFRFVIQSSNDETKFLTNVSFSTLSTGLALLVIDGCSLLNLLFVMTKRKHA